jgi:hypothetical protein
MDERDLVAEDPASRPLVDQLGPGRGQPGELGGHIVDLERDVVHARAAAGHEPADGRVRTVRG